MHRRLLLVSGSIAIVAWVLWALLSQPLRPDPSPILPTPGTAPTTITSTPAREEVATMPAAANQGPPAAATPRTLQIRVTDTANHPAADAVVRVRRGVRVGHDGELLAEMRTDTAGRTSYTALPEPIAVDAEHAGARSGSTPIAVEWPADRVVEVCLDELAVIPGRVESATGVPIANAQIQVRHTSMAMRGDHPRPLAPTTSRADGSFELRVPLAGTFGVVATYGAESSADVYFDTHAHTPNLVLVQFPGAWTVRGRVLGVDGTPRQAEVRLWECLPDTAEFYHHEPITARRVTEADGTFSLPLPRLGTYLVVAKPNRSRQAEPETPSEMNSAMQRVHLTSASPTVECTLQLSRPTPVRGRVTHADGRPAAGARLVMLPETNPSAGMPRGPRYGEVFTPLGMVTTSERGEFEFAAVQTGTTYRLHVWPDDRNERVSAIRSGIVAGGQPVHVTLSPSEARGARLRLHLVFDDDGSPVPDCRIDYVFYERGQPESSSPLEVTAEGNVLVSQPLGCGHEFGITIRDRVGMFANDDLVCSPVHVGPIVLSSDETRVIQVPRPVNLPVYVIDSDGRACPGLQVALHPLSPRATANMLHAGETDATGNVRFRGTETGESKLTVSHGNKRLTELTIVVRSGVNPPVTVQLD